MRKLISIYFTETQQTFHKNEPLSCNTPYTGAVREGWHEQYYSTGKLQYQFFYRNGVRDGLSKAYYPNGRPSHEFLYESGQIKSGTLWRPNTQKSRLTERQISQLNAGIAVLTDYVEQPSVFHDSQANTDTLMNSARLFYGETIEGFIGSCRGVCSDDSETVWSDRVFIDPTKQHIVIASYLSPMDSHRFGQTFEKILKDDFVLKKGNQSLTEGLDRLQKYDYNAPISVLATCIQDGIATFTGGGECRGLIIRGNSIAFDTKSPALMEISFLKSTFIQLAKVQKGDTVLLISKGVSDLLMAHELLEIVCQHVDPEDSLNSLSKELHTRQTAGRFKQKKDIQKTPEINVDHDFSKSNQSFYQSLSAAVFKIN